MKIEKLTENKIRVIITSKDLGSESTDLNSLMEETFETQSLFFEILTKAEKEVGFYTEGYKLLIEAFSEIDGFLIFTITKTERKNSESNNYINKNKRLIIKRKSPISNKNFAVYKFDNFDQFCELCNFLKNISNLNISKLSKNSLLYLYNDTYYLILENINNSHKSINKFYFILSEFGNSISNSDYLKDKIIEHGKVIMKKNAINTCINFFVN